MGSSCQCGKASTGYKSNKGTEWQSNTGDTLGLGNGWYSGAVNQKLFNGKLNDQNQPNCGGACGSCYELQTTGTNTYGMKNSPDGGSTLRMMVVDACYNQNGAPNWCSNNGKSGPKTDDFGCDVHFDIDTSVKDVTDTPGPTSKQGHQWACTYMLVLENELPVS